MILCDKKKLIEELEKMKEAEPTQGLQDLKKLFLLLSGDKRVARQATMEDIAELFNNTAALLDLYFDDLEYVFNCDKLKVFECSTRRAV